MTAHFLLEKRLRRFDQQVRDANSQSLVLQSTPLDYLHCGLWLVAFDPYQVFALARLR